MANEPDISVFRPDRPGIRKVLGDLEAEIMELIWARPTGQGTTVREVFEVLYERRRVAYTTAMNTMMATTLISANQYSNSPNLPTCRALIVTKPNETTMTQNHCETVGNQSAK